MKALIVDDNMINLKVTKKLLENLGLTSDIALSGQECLKMVKKVNYDIIFMDIMMPEMDGVETFKQLRENNYSMPIIALTADVDLDSKDKYLSLGFNDYIPKPINLDLLKELLNKYLNL